MNALLREGREGGKLDKESLREPQGSRRHKRPWVAKLGLRRDERPRVGHFVYAPGAESCGAFCSL